MPAERAARTTISLTVKGCDGCDVQPVQNRRGQITYWGAKKTVHDGEVSFRVPSRRTHDMAFLVYAPFDEIAQDGIPMVVVTQFKAKKAGQSVPDAYASKRRKASGCWAGTTKHEVANTLVVKQRRQHGRIVAAGWLKRTWRSGPYWWTVRAGTYHASDPSVCP
ncbi:MAG TPA: hypothetical protein VFT70_10235 [Nocardioides sp.]|nr:hypothetical protein [Nocardioides sp.]